VEGTPVDAVLTGAEAEGRQRRRRRRGLSALGSGHVFFSLRRFRVALRAPLFARSYSFLGERRRGKEREDDRRRRLATP
jgi:hypothetical protein